MKFAVFSFVCCVSVLFLVDETNAQAMRINDSQHSDHPGLCYYDDYFGKGENKFFLKPGHRRRHPKLCFEVKCEDDFSMTTIGCGVGANIGHCHYINGDNSKPYPHCCGEKIC